VDVVENTPRTLSRDLVTFGHYVCCATSGCVHSREPRRGQATFGSHVTTTKKKAREKNGACAESSSGLDRFRTWPLPVTWLCHFRSKGPTGRIWHNFRLRMSINYFRTWSLPVAWLTLLPVTWLPVAPHSTSANTTLSVPIYYWYLLITILFEKGILPHIIYFYFSLLAKQLFCGFIDFRKAFDTVWRTDLWKIVINSGIKGKTFTVVYNMYDNIK
jgi:hypothetical protein